MQNVASITRSPAILNSGEREASGADEHHVHRQAPAALLDEVAAPPAPGPRPPVFPGSYASRKIQKPSVLMRTLSRTDSSSSVALHRPREVELDVERDELDGRPAARKSRTVIT